MTVNFVDWDLFYFGGLAALAWGALTMSILSRRLSLLLLGLVCIDILLYMIALRGYGMSTWPELAGWMHGHVRVFGHAAIALYILTFYFLAKQGDIYLPGARYLVSLAAMHGVLMMAHALGFMEALDRISPFVNICTGFALVFVSAIMVRRRVVAAHLMLLTNVVLLSRLMASAMDRMGFTEPFLSQGKVLAWMYGPQLSLISLAINLTLIAAWVNQLTVQRNRAMTALARWQEQEQERLQSEVEKQTNALNQALRYADEANRKKTEGLGYISHDLRAPLSAILGDAQMLMPALDAGQKRYMRSIAQSVHYQLALIDNLLEYSRREFETFSLHPVALSLEQLMDATSQFALALSTRQHNHFHYQPQSPLPEAVMLDGRRLQQVLLNLLANAAKFTQRGQIMLEVDAAPCPQGWTLRFSVSDSGVGISQDAQSHMFNAYTQAYPQYGGVGLGLFIARQIVEAMGGTLELESTPGVGSCFSFRIAVRSADPGSIVPQPTFGMPAEMMEWPDIEPARTSDHPAPPAHARVELAIHARDGQLSKIEAWLSKARQDYPAYQDFFDEVAAALEPLDFEYIEVLALAADTSPEYGLGAAED